MQPFARWWPERFGDTPPLGWRLREVFPDRWLRVHSLPEAKRFAETPLERAEVRRRAWACAAELLPSGDDAWVVTCTYGEPRLECTLPEARSLTFQRAFDFEGMDEDLTGTAHVAVLAWPHDGFDDLIDAIAADRIRVLWGSATTAEVFAPYDGGVDLILGSSRRRDRLRCAFSEWLPKNRLRL